MSLYVRDIGSDKDPVVIAKTDYSYDLPALIRVGLLLHVYDFYRVIFHLLCSWRHWKVSVWLALPIVDLGWRGVYISNSREGHRIMKLRMKECYLARKFRRI